MQDYIPIRKGLKKIFHVPTHGLEREHPQPPG